MKTIQVTKDKRYAIKKEWNSERWLYGVMPQRKIFLWWLDGDFVSRLEKKLEGEIPQVTKCECICHLGDSPHHNDECCLDAEYA